MQEDFCQKLQRLETEGKYKGSFFLNTVKIVVTLFQIFPENYSLKMSRAARLTIKRL